MIVQKLKGFTAVELLVTLFVAALALAAGYQLYSAVIKEDGNSRTEAAVGIRATEKVRSNLNGATTPCTPSTPVSNVSSYLRDIGPIKTTVAISCPNLNLPNLSQITTTILYGAPEKTVVRSSYITPGGL